jgi:hypothetical protein
MQMPRNACYCYALKSRAADYIALGWLCVAELGPTHGTWSVLAVWLCECRPAVLPCRN